MDASLHKSFDRYAFFIIIPSEKQRSEMKTILESDLKERQTRWDSKPEFTGGPVRSYNKICPEGSPIRTAPEFQLVLLHPNQFLPNGMPLLRRNLTTPGYTSYTVSHHGTLADPTGNDSDFACFQYPSQRKAGHAPSIFCFTLNAYGRSLTFRKRYSLSVLSYKVRKAV